MTSGTDGISRVQVLGVPFAQVTRERLAAYSIDALESPSTTIVFAVHVVGVNLLGRDAAYERALSSADLIHADGAAAMLVVRAAGQRLPERVTTQDYMYDTIAHAAAHDHPVYVLGGPPGLAAAAAARLAGRFPGLKIAGARDGYFDDAEGAAVATEIAASGAHLLFVGMGCPREQIWAAEHGRDTGAREVITCGGTFGYIVGEESRAPRWVQKSRMEWVWRMAQDPRRLAGRYLGGIRPLLSQMRRARRASHQGSSRRRSV